MMLRSASTYAAMKPGPFFISTAGFASSVASSRVWVLDWPSLPLCIQARGARRSVFRSALTKISSNGDPMSVENSSSSRTAMKDSNARMR